MNIVVEKFRSKQEMYAQIKSQVDAIFAEAQDLYAGLSNSSALLKLYLTDINWVGFYLLKNGELILGPFQGKPAVSHIKVGSGVCGTAVKERAVQREDDVKKCSNHIACDIASASEIVCPIFLNGEVFGVIDIDSPILARFDAEDENGLQEVADVIAKALTGLEMEK